ncbi:MAG: Gfo/Idh/MocA family oxidoreductase [bacterium]
MIRLAFLGCGYNLDHMEVVRDRPDVEIVAVFSRELTKAKKIADKFGGKPYNDYREMLANEKIDAAYLGLPPHTRGEPELCCIERKIHLFIEKPVALDIATAETIQRKAEENGVFLFAGYKYRYSHLVQELAEKLKQEKIVFFNGYYNITGAPQKEWWRRKEMSGGQLVEQATHIVDLVRLFFGEIVERNLVVNTVSYKELNIPDSSAMLIKCSQGTIGCIHASFADSVSEAGLMISSSTKRFVLTTEWPEVKLLIRDESGEQTFQEDERVCRMNESNIFLDAVKNGSNDAIKHSYREAILTLKATL